VCPPVIDFAKWNSWRLLRAARNAQREFTALERAGCVVVETNRPQAIVALINFLMSIMGARHCVSCDATRAAVLSACVALLRYCRSASIHEADVTTPPLRSSTARTVVSGGVDKPSSHLCQVRAGFLPRTPAEFAAAAKVRRRSSRHVLGSVMLPMVRYIAHTLY